MRKSKGGRPGGETSYSGKGLMTKYTRGSSGKPSMKIQGRTARSNGIKQLKGRSGRNVMGPTGKQRG